MKILTIDPRKPKTSPIAQAVDVLLAGGVIVYPTDTAYGLGVDATNDMAVRKLYGLKKRALTKPTHVIVKDWAMIEELCITTSVAKKIYDALMPGPITMVLDYKGVVSEMLTGGLGTLGVRIPKNETTKCISDLFSRPFTTPSANASDMQTPYSIQEVKQALDLSLVDLVLDAGPLPVSLTSTIVGLATSEPLVYREGAISKAQIVSALKV